MIKTLTSRVCLVTASAAVAALAGAALVSMPTAGAAPTAPTPAPQPTSAVVSHASTLSPQAKKLIKGRGVAAQRTAVEKFWTPARMKSAISLDAVKINGKAPAAKPDADAPQGKAVSIAGKSPLVTPRVGSAPKKKPNYDYPGFPYYHPTARTVGKVFFSRTNAGVTSYFVCSGAVVNSEGKSLVWTAGHCIYDFANGKTGARVWNQDFAFVPSYSNGSRPYGTWYASSMTTTPGWYSNRDFGQDVGATTMYRNFGYRIADYLGSQGIGWNQSANFYASAFGYPADYPFNGQWLYRATGNTVNVGNNTIYMYSGLTGGSSGGPWLRNWDGNYGYVNGHNDFVYTSSPAYMYSPYYGNQVAQLYNAVRYATS